MVQTSIEKLQTWLTEIVSGLVTHAEDIKIIVVEDEQGILFTLEVNREDRGKVIGKEGAIANSIRTILRSAGQLIGVRVSMKVDAGTKFSPNREQE